MDYNPDVLCPETSHANTKQTNLRKYNMVFNWDREACATRFWCPSCQDVNSVLTKSMSICLEAFHMMGVVFDSVITVCS